MIGQESNGKGGTRARNATPPAPQSTVPGPHVSRFPERRAVLGVDPGLNCTGYAILERGTRGPVLREAGVIRSTAKLTLAERVAEIGCGLRDVLTQYNVEAMAVEQVFSTGQYPKTALLMAHARGAILFAAAERNVRIIHY